MAKLKIYYAHAMSWYDTLNEDYDMKLLEQQGEVTNPNSEPFTTMVKIVQASNVPTMSVFIDWIVNFADVVAFRSFKDGKISADVAQEVLTARLHGKQIWHIHNTTIDKNPEVRNQFDFEQAFHLDNILSIEATRDRIKKGQL